MSLDKTTITQAEYDALILEYGQQFFFHVLKHKHILRYQGESIVQQDQASSFFTETFLIFEKKAREFFNPQDPEHKLLDLYFNILMKNTDIQNIRFFENSGSDYIHMQKNIDHLLKSLIDMSALETHNFANMPLYTKQLLQKETPQNTSDTFSTPKRPHKL